MTTETPKTTHRLHRQPIPTPTGPVELTVDYEAEQLIVPGEIPLSHLRAVVFGLNEIDKEWQKRKNSVCTTRKIEGD